MFVGQRRAVAGTRRTIGEEAEVLGAAQRRFRHVADRLAGIAAFDERNLFGPRDDIVRDRMQDGAALRTGNAAPRFERGCRGNGGAVNVFRIAGRDPAKNGIAGRIKRLERLAGARRRGLAANQMQSRNCFEAREMLLRQRKI